MTTKTEDDPRIFPEIPRDRPSYTTYYRQRTGCERSFATKKVVYDLEGCNHRRQSFWLIRSYGIAMLQHARAWVASLDLVAFVRALLEPSTPPLQPLAA